MNKAIQSNSYRGYSESLLKQWIEHFSKISGENFLYANLHNCLIDFKNFGSDFIIEAGELSKQDENFQALDENGKKNFEIWRGEKISKALDEYWAPLSQAATQYTSPAYTEHIKTFIDLTPTIKGYLDKLNQLTGDSNENKITMNDLVLYFDELTMIRLAPYTKTALIGVPFRVIESASSSNEEKLTGIAHELGHFLYWRLAEFNQIEIRHEDILRQISELLKGKRNDQDERGIRFIRAWFEELFADFIGANIAGNTYVKSCKEMIIRNNKSSSRLGENDQEHVSDILRPLACIYTIDQKRDSSMASWKKFFSDDFPVDMENIRVKTFREDDNQRDIERSPEELSRILLDTIDILTEQIEKKDQGFFYTNFADVSSAIRLKEKADRLEKKQRENPNEHLDSVLTALDIFLEPRILEAGVQSHSHTVKTIAHAYSFTAYHTH